MTFWCPVPCRIRATLHPWSRQVVQHLPGGGFGFRIARLPGYFSRSASTFGSWELLSSIWSENPVNSHCAPLARIYYESATTSRKLPKSFSQSPKPLGMSGFSRLSVNRDQQRICQDCKKIEGLFEHRRNQTALPSVIKCQFHENFNEFQTCAARCYSCRVFLRALLLRQFTTLNAKRIKHLSTSHQIWTSLKEDILNV